MPVKEDSNEKVCSLNTDCILQLKVLINVLRKRIDAIQAEKNEKMVTINIDADYLPKLRLLGNALGQQRITCADIDGRLISLRNIIETNISGILKENAPPNAYELFTDLKKDFQQFRLFTLFDKLHFKSVVALGGAVSSGKTSFINAINDEKGIHKLPEKLPATTAIPTFIVYGDKRRVSGTNIFDDVMEMEIADIKNTVHNFSFVIEKEGTTNKYPVSIHKVINTIFLETPNQKYKNMAFVDTPGYSKAENNTYTARTDESVSRAQLNDSSYIIYFVTADQGTLKKDDIDFVKSLRDDIPKLFIISKANKKPLEYLKEIANHLKRQLTDNKIKYIDVLKFSSEKPDDYDANIIRKQLDVWNDTPNEPRFSKNFERFFKVCLYYYNKIVGEKRKQLIKSQEMLSNISNEETGKLHSLLKLSNDIKTDRDYYINNYPIGPLSESMLDKRFEEREKQLNTVWDDVKCIQCILHDYKMLSYKEIESIKNTRKEMKKIQRLFFDEIKTICSEIGIEI